MSWKSSSIPRLFWNRGICSLSPSPTALRISSMGLRIISAFWRGGVRRLLLHELRTRRLLACAGGEGGEPKPKLQRPSTAILPTRQPTWQPTSISTSTYCILHTAYTSSSLRCAYGAAWYGSLRNLSLFAHRFWGGVGGGGVCGEGEVCLQMQIFAIHGIHSSKQAAGTKNGGGGGVFVILKGKGKAGGGY